MRVRSPTEDRRYYYFKRLKIKEYMPILTGEQCVKCGQWYRFETMFKVIIPHPVSSRTKTFDKHLYGCTHCFPLIDFFQEYLQEKRYILTEKSDLDWFCFGGYIAKKTFSE